ncbi:hypothetical protein ACS0TY_025317 [Phlomoides rotata]
MSGDRGIERRMEVQDFRSERRMEDSKVQVTSIHLIIGTLQRMHVFWVENRDALTQKTTGSIDLPRRCHCH